MRLWVKKRVRDENDNVTHKIYSKCGELKGIDEFYNLELSLSNNQKVLDKLENDKINLEKKLETVTREYNFIKSNTDLMIDKKREMEKRINEMIKNINK